MTRPSETTQVDIGPDEIVKSNSCSNGSYAYMNDVSLSDLPDKTETHVESIQAKKISPGTSSAN